MRLPSSPRRGKASAPHYPAVTDMTDVEAARRVALAMGWKINVYCIGQGSPAAIFEAGPGGRSRRQNCLWVELHDGVAAWSSRGGNDIIAAAATASSSTGPPR